MMMKITSDDVPSYLRDGTLFDSFDIADSESFEMPPDCCKQDTTVQSHSDLRFLIRSLSFWAVDDLPVEVILFLIAHDDLELTQISAEFQEYDRSWKMIATLKTYPSEQTIEGAIKVGFSLNVMQGLHTRDDFPLTAKACVAAATSSTAESVEILTYLHQQGCPWDTATTDAAARTGNISCLTYAHENGCGLSTECLYIAARAGQLVSVKYLHSVGVSIHTEKAIEHASVSLNLEVIQYLCESGCILTPFSCQYFALRDSVECLKYAHERGCPWGREICALAALSGAVRCLEYAHMHGCPWDSDTTTSAARQGHVECLKYAHSRGCPLDHSAMDCAIQAGSWQCFWYTLKNGCISSDLSQISVLSFVLVVTIFSGGLNILFHTGPACHLIECALNLFYKPVLSRRTMMVLRWTITACKVAVAAAVIYIWYTDGDLGISSDHMKEQ